MRPPTGKPCKECPFRVKAAPGWLGESNSEEFLAEALSEEEMPCHMAVNYENPDWRQLLGGVPQCSGRAIFLTHACKMPRNKNIVRLPANKAIIASPPAFLKHHAS